jgi:hypothetical protein
MNFNWMIDHIGSREAFLVCGLLLPALSVIISVGYFRRCGLIYFKPEARPKGGHAAQAREDWAWPPHLHGGAPADPIAAEHKTQPHSQNPDSKKVSA